MYCTGTAEAQNTLTMKKRNATNAGYPDRFVALYDHLDQCQAIIEGSPDGFTLFLVGTDDSIETGSQWTAENEHNDAVRVKNGELKACYVVLQRRADPPCCGLQKYTDRRDYDPKLDLSTDLATPCQE
jgi:hypothetical protein